MTLKLNGTNSVAAPAYAGDDADTGLQCGTNELKLVTGGTARATVDSSGRVLVGTTSGTAKVEAVDSSFHQFYARGSGNVGGVRFGNTTKTNGYIYYDNGGNMNFHADGAERMRIDQHGNVLVNTTAATNTPSNGIALMTNSTIGSIGIGHASGTGSGNTYAHFCLGGTSIGTISQNGTNAVSYNTSSDYRLKENVVDITDGITRVKQLSPKRFNFISDADTTVDGFLAHEAQTVVPEAVTGTHDEVDDDGNAVMQGIDQSKLVPLLTAALKEAIAKIETLETKVAALEAAA